MNAAITQRHGELEGSPHGRREGQRAPPDRRDELEEVAAQDARLIGRRQAQQAYFGQLDAGMEPGPIRAEQDLVGASPPDGLNEQVKAPHARGVGVDVRVAGQGVEEGHLRRASRRQSCPGGG